jgi:hypothetical protein
MANPDLSAIATSFVERGGPIFAKRVLNWQLRKQGVQVRTNVKTPQAMTKLSAVGGPRPYRAVDDIAGNGVKFTDRTLTVYNSKWDYDFDPEEFRNTYLANDPQVPFAQAAAEQVAKEYLAGIQTSTLVFRRSQRSRRRRRGHLRWMGHYHRRCNCGHYTDANSDWCDHQRERGH